MTKDVLMSVDDDDKELQESSWRLQDGKKNFDKNGVSEEECSLHKDDGLKSNGIAEDVEVGHGRIVEAGSSVQNQTLQQQPRGVIVRWERFLHLRSLNVLLVENDDSTRHVVTALLRNCSYEVIETANGLQAWKILKDLTRNIDLVLTEVAMPCLSGIGLLCKIMSHKTRRNLPVIMMSTHDSMGLVFNCLSKGAVDFLVKPIRKNELKNLWQHVWRRCHSSSSSGSESGIQTTKSVKSKSLEKFDDNSGSNNEDDKESMGLNNGDGSDNGHGTQSSWTKQDVEIDSPKPVSKWNHITECPDSTCAQVVHSNAEICGKKMVPLATYECPEQKEQLVKELRVDSSRDFDLTVEYNNGVPGKTSGSKHCNPLDVGTSKFNMQISRGQLGLNCESQSSKPRCKGLLLSDSITHASYSKIHGGAFEAPIRRLKSLDIENKAINNNEEFRSLELSLKRHREVKDDAIKIQNERNVLQRSDLSSFSRYNAAANDKKFPAGCVESNSPHNNSLDISKKESSRETQSRSSGNPPKQNSNGTSNNIDMGSTTNNAFMIAAVTSGPAVVSTTKCLYQSSAVQPLKNKLNYKQAVSHDTEDVTATAMLAPPRLGTHNDSTTQDIHCQFGNRNCTANNMQHQLSPDHGYALLDKMAAAAFPHCVSTNVVEVIVEGNIGNYRVNRSTSGSNNRSNRKNGSSTAINAGGMNIESNPGIVGNSGRGNALGSRKAKRVNQNKISQREAVLIKFHQKRKRFFQKKVRYQRRKKLTKGRP